MVMEKCLYFLTDLPPPLRSKCANVSDALLNRSKKAEQDNSQFALYMKYNGLPIEVRTSSAVFVCHSFLLQRIYRAKAHSL